ncbi:hypothetical protein [Streptomyces sp. NPDC058595]|uniref:hypothetical protein n=1 Tax=Streptomyces sp. NPDC058595 TaxID=3346550 RepID=UPI00364BB847
MHSVMHSAADEIRAGRLTSDHAAAHITATVLAAFTPPGKPVPNQLGERDTAALFAGCRARQVFGGFASPGHRRSAAR